MRQGLHHSFTMNMSAQLQLNRWKKEELCGRHSDVGKSVDLNFRKQTLFAYKNQEFNEKQQENVHLMKGDVNGTSPYVISFLLYGKCYTFEDGVIIR